MTEGKKNQDKKILIITHQLSRTGAPIVLLDMIQVLLKQGYQLEVITMLDGELREELQKMNIPLKVQEHFMDQTEAFWQYVENLIW